MITRPYREGGITGSSFMDLLIVVTLFLFMASDVFASPIHYTFESDTISMFENASPINEKYIQSLDYTWDMETTYKVDFVYDQETNLLTDYTVFFGGHELALTDTNPIVSATSDMWGEGTGFTLIGSLPLADYTFRSIFHITLYNGGLDGTFTSLVDHEQGFNAATFLTLFNSTEDYVFFYGLNSYASEAVFDLDTVEASVPSASPVALLLAALVSGYLYRRKQRL